MGTSCLLNCGDARGKEELVKEAANYLVEVFKPVKLAMDGR